MAERRTWPQPDGEGLWGQGSRAHQTAFASLLHVKRLSALWEVKSHQTCCLWSRSPQQPGARFAHPPAPHFMVGEAKAERGKNSQFAANALLVFLIAAVRVGFQVPADQYHSHFFTGEVNSWITFHRWPPNAPHYVFDTLLDTLCKL